MAGVISIIAMVVGSVGLFLGFYFLASDPIASLKIVTMTTVGIVGVLAFIRHVIFHKSDAKRLGWETDRPDWMYEVGFANLSFGAIAVLSVCREYSQNTQAIVLLGYALYLLQAAALHGFRYFTETPRSASRLWRSVMATLLYAGMMAFFALKTLSLHL